MHQNFGAPENTEIVGVRFRDTGKVYYFSPEGITAKEGGRWASGGGSQISK